MSPSTEDLDKDEGAGEVETEYIEYPKPSLVWVCEFVHVATPVFIVVVVNDRGVRMPPGFCIEGPVCATKLNARLLPT